MREVYLHPSRDYIRSDFSRKVRIDIQIHSSVGEPGQAGQAGRVSGPGQSAGSLLRGHWIQDRSASSSRFERRQSNANISTTCCRYESYVCMTNHHENVL